MNAAQFQEQFFLKLYKTLLDNKDNLRFEYNITTQNKYEFLEQMTDILIERLLHDEG